MIRQSRTAIFVCALAALSVVATYRWRHAMPDAAERSLTIAFVRSAPREIPDSTFADLEETIASSDPFRLANAPASVRYDPSAEARPGTSPSVALAIRPMMTLKAIVGGPPWQGIVDGIPGQPAGTIVRDGLVFEKLTVRSVTRDSIIIQGSDTAWVLSFRRRD